MALPRHSSPEHTLSTSQEQICHVQFKNPLELYVRLYQILCFVKWGEYPSYFESLWASLVGLSALNQESPCRSDRSWMLHHTSPDPKAKVTVETLLITSLGYEFFLLYYFLSPTFIAWIQFFLFLLPKKKKTNPVVRRACRKIMSEEQSHKLSRKTHALHAAFICSRSVGVQWITRVLYVLYVHPCYARTFTGELTILPFNLLPQLCRLFNNPGQGSWSF